MTRIGDNRNVKAFFSLVGSEVWAWDELEECLSRSGLPVTLGRFIPLYNLVDHPMRLQELSACCYAKESAMCRLVGRMIRDGLIAKESDPSDHRAVILCLTEQGRRVEEQAETLFRAHLEDMFEDIAPEELDSLIRMHGVLAGR